MAEKEVKIKVTTETDTKDIEDLESRLEELKSEKLELQIISDTAELESVKTEIEETENRLSELKGEVSVDTSEIDSLQTELDLTNEVLETMTGNINIDDSQLQDVESRANELQSQIEELQTNVTVNTTEIDELENKLTELEGTQIDLEISVNSAELDQAKGSMDELESKSNEVSSSIDGVGSALTGIAAAAGLEQMVTTADNINNSWNRLELTFANTGVSIGQLKQKQSELQASTGQTGGTIRNFFNMMGIAGVTNVGLLSSSFEALSGKAYQTGQSVEQMESKFQRMVMSGNASSRMLVSMGISAEDLARAMGVSASEVSEAFKNMTPEERIQALTKAMGEGKQANEMYKNSFQGLKTQAEASLAGLVGAVGQAILPSIIPLLNLAKDAITALTNAFKSLPEPVQQIIGGLGAVALAAVTLIGVLGTVGTIIKTVKSGIQALNGIMKIWEGVTKAVELAQAALNFVMALNPIVLVVAAIVALIAILVYLYYTNEDVRNAIDGFGQALWGIGEAIYGGVMSALQQLQGALQWLSDSFWGVVNLFNTYAPLIAQVLFVMATGGIGAIVLLVANFMGMPNQVGQALQNVINRVLGFVSSLVSNFTNGARQSVANFMNQIRSLPGKFLAELNRMLSYVNDWAATLPAKFWEAGVNAVKNFLNALGIHSPGFMAVNFGEEIKRLEDSATYNDIADRIGGTAKDIVHAWGNPTFTYGFETNTKGDVDTSTMELTSNGDIISLLKTLVDLIKGNNTGNSTFNFTLNGDIDNEERMEKFLEAVRRDFYWNNEKAGRNVEEKYGV